MDITGVFEDYIETSKVTWTAILTLNEPDVFDPP